MHPVLLVLAAWFAVIVLVLAFALAAGRSRSRRSEFLLAELFEREGS